MNRFLFAGLLCLALSAQAFAETVYVKERQVVSVHSGPAAADDVVTKAVSGTSLELVEQGDVYTKIRTTDGTEGWIANSLIGREKPSALRILSAETRLKQAKTETKKLAKEVKSLKAKLNTTQSEPSESAGQTQTENSAKDGSLSNLGVIIWLGISFAMLIAGFVAGVVWLRERTRRKLGGMHIRVS